MPATFRRRIGDLNKLQDAPGGFQVLGIRIKNNLRVAGQGERPLPEPVDPPDQ